MGKRTRRKEKKSPKMAAKRATKRYKTLLET